MTTNAPVRVLVVDDSAFARKVLREVLNGDGIEVIEAARDGLDALEKIAALAPDVVTLDLVMPNLDGVGVLRALEGRRTPPVIVVSMAGEDSEIGIAALDCGAFDVVVKPTALATEKLYELRNELRDKVFAAARRPGRPAVRRPRESVVPTPWTAKAIRTKLLVIGASTGGPQALTSLLRALPADFPVPVAIVLHMPPGYTDAFARRVDAECALSVMEAREGLSLQPGLVVVARAGIHLRFRSENGSVSCAFDALPTTTPHRPAVDVLFQEAATLYGERVLGVVLTGMGSDGLAGSRAICAGGGRVLTESESSCVVYGMPRSVYDAGISSAEAPIESMAALILEHL